MNREEALALAQDNAAEEIASFLNKYVPKELHLQALADIPSILQHYDCTIDLLPEYEPRT